MNSYNVRSPSSRSLISPTCISQKMSIVSTKSSLPQWQMSANDTPVIPHERSNIRLPSINELMASFVNEDSVPRNSSSYFKRENSPIYYEQGDSQSQPQSQPPLSQPLLPQPQLQQVIPSPPLSANDSTPSYSTSSSISTASSSSSTSSTSSSIQMLLDASTSTDNIFNSKKRSHSVSSASSNTSTTNTNTNNTASSISPPPFSASPYSPPLKRRGNLPRAVTDILRNWLSSHLHYPYPTEQEKIELMKQTGLSLNQVSNWFINARRRRVPAIYKHSGMMNVQDRPRRTVSDGANLPRNIPPPSISQLNQQQHIPQQPQQQPLPISQNLYTRQTQIPPQWKP